MYCSFLPGVLSLLPQTPNFLPVLRQVPELRRKSVELNGLQLSHALLSTSQLAVKCAQHYSWSEPSTLFLVNSHSALKLRFTPLSLLPQVLLESHLCSQRKPASSSGHFFPFWGLGLLLTGCFLWPTQEWISGRCHGPHSGSTTFPLSLSCILPLKS